MAPELSDFFLVTLQYMSIKNAHGCFVSATLCNESVFHFCFQQMFLTVSFVAHLGGSIARINRKVKS